MRTNKRFSPFRRSVIVKVKLVLKLPADEAVGQEQAIIVPVQIRVPLPDKHRLTDPQQRLIRTALSQDLPQNWLN